MIIRTGKLKQKDYIQLGEPNPKYDTTDIPLIITKGIDEDLVQVNNAYMGIQYRTGGFKAKSVEVNNVVNDCISCWSGDINIDLLHGSHNVPVFYSKNNHPDVFQSFSMDHKTYERHSRIVNNIRIKEVDFTVVGEDKNIFMFTGISGYNNIKLFENGCKIKVKGKPLKSKLFLNSISFTNSEFGSPSYPLDIRKTSGLGIRISGVKPNSPKSSNIVIHCYKGLPIDLSKQVKENTTIVYYNRTQTLNERLTRWSIYKDIIELGIK